MQKLFDKFKLVYFILVVIILFACQFLSFIKIIDNYTSSIIISILGLIGLILYVTDKVLCKRKVNKFDIIIYLLILFGIISSIFSINFKVSILGFRNRNEGLLILITYYILFLNIKSISNKRYKNIIFNLILVYGLLHAIYGIMQYFRIETFLKIPIRNNGFFYSSAFETNSNFFSTISVMVLFLSLSRFFFDNNKSSIIYGLLSIIYFMALLCSGAMSGALTFIVVFIILLIMLIIKKVKIIPTTLKIIFIIISFMLCYGQFNDRNHGYLMGQVENMGSEIENVSKGNFNEKYGTGRIHIWKETLKIIPDNIITGVGIDNFYYGFGDKPIIDIKSHLKVDKAHNEYLQKLVTEGVFSLISYLILLMLVVILGIKKVIKEKREDNVLLISLLFGFMAYSVQAFFNISVICVAPLFYIIMGLIIGEVYEKD